MVKPEERARAWRIGQRITASASEQTRPPRFRGSLTRNADPELAGLPQADTRQEFQFESRTSKRDGERL